MRGVSRSRIDPFRSRRTVRLRNNAHPVRAGYGDRDAGPNASRGVRMLLKAVCCIGIPVLATAIVLEASNLAPKFDVVVYGSTAGGVVTAVAAACQGVSVALPAQNYIGCHPTPPTSGSFFELLRNLF